MPVVPYDSIVALTFLPSTPYGHFGSWLQPISSVMLVALFDPSILGLARPGTLILRGMKALVRARIAVTEWSAPAFTYCLSEEALLQGHSNRLDCPSDLSALVFSMHATLRYAGHDISRLVGRPRLPRTLCAVDPSAVVDPSPSKAVWDHAHDHQLTPAEAYASLYDQWCVSPRCNYTEKLLIDTRLVCRLDGQRGFTGSNIHDNYLDIGSLKGSPSAVGLHRAHGQLAPHGPVTSTTADPLCASHSAGIQTWLLPYRPSFGSVFHREARSTLRIDRNLVAHALPAFYAA